MSYVGSEALLNAEQLRTLDEHLQTQVYPTSADVVRYVEQHWCVRYTPSGMSALLHRLGYVYKQPKLQPGKHTRVETQEAFIAKYHDLKDTKAEADVIVFMDAMHPQHNPVLGCGWIKRGKTQPIQSNTGRQRLNTNGAINIATLQLEYRFDDTIDAVSTTALFDQLQEANPSAPRIIVICDNARYYKSKAKECRRARDTFWDSMSQNDCARRQPVCAPVRPASVALRRHLARSMPAAHHSLK